VVESATYGRYGPDVMEKVSDVNCGNVCTCCCSGYEANYDKLYDTRSPGEAENMDTEKNKEKITADVTKKK
jgi:hypothetical protein